MASDLDKLASLQAKYQDEDRRLSAALEDAARTGGPTPKDGRTPEERRVNERSAIETSLWANCKVLAEAVDRANHLIAENEDRWLADLRARDAEAQVKVEEAARLLQEAQSARFHLARLGGWLKQQGGPFGAQPAPSEDEPVPDLLDVDSMFEQQTRRPWFDQRGAASAGASGSG